ncbi:MAG: hypothetical protein HOP12_07015 [Candidatus Eisenbacteria bacterium]|uniref:Uncharacterized protein n=1 Tax=Eiseniibacteriota bacterium TaxID=2212470 RepID=A0A849SMS2_UNCEI|nr:hypothetical protein [Candidatus Eisenbacteria bacterium]
MEPRFQRDYRVARERDGTLVLSYAVGRLGALMGRLLGRRERIAIRPGEGLICAGARLAFGDIEEIGVFTDESSARRASDPTSYVFAHWRGRRVSITRRMPYGRAEAIRREIVACSGHSWR